MWEDFRRWSDSLILQLDADGAEAEKHRGNVAEVSEYFALACQERLNNPTDDVVSRIVAGVVGGEPLTRDEWIAYCYTLVVAGNETTRNSISGSVRRSVFISISASV